LKPGIQEFAFMVASRPHAGARIETLFQLWLWTSPPVAPTRGRGLKLDQGKGGHRRAIGRPHAGARIETTRSKCTE